jgi:hypothetical protein
LKRTGASSVACLPVKSSFLNWMKRGMSASIMVSALVSSLPQAL